MCQGIANTTTTATVTATGNVLTVSGAGTPGTTDTITAIDPPDGTSYAVAAVPVSANGTFNASIPNPAPAGASVLISAAAGHRVAVAAARGAGTGGAPIPPLPSNPTVINGNFTVLDTTPPGNYEATGNITLDLETRGRTFTGNLDAGGNIYLRVGTLDGDAWANDTATLWSDFQLIHGTITVYDAQHASVALTIAQNTTIQGTLIVGNGILRWPSNAPWPWSNLWLQNGSVESIAPLTWGWYVYDPAPLAAPSGL